MYKQRRKRSKRSYILLAIVILAITLLLLRPAVHYAKPIYSVEKKETQSYSALDDLPNGFVFTVSVNNRYYHLAKKVSKGRYELQFINNNSLQVGDGVETSGLDGQLAPELPLGNIIRIDRSGIMATIVVGY